MTRSRRTLIGLGVLALLAVFVAVLRILVYRDQGEVWFAWPGSRYAGLRLTALAVGVTAGVSLATSGVLLQALLRNPLASPFILGISAGAGLGVMVAMYITNVVGIPNAGPGSQMLPALIGALGVLALVYGLSQRHGWLDPVSLVLVGVIISSICGALIMFFQHLVPTGLHGEITRWMMGRVPQGTPGWMIMVTGLEVLPVDYYRGIGVEFQAKRDQLCSALEKRILARSGSSGGGVRFVRTAH